MGNYYCLMAGLPDLNLNNTGSNYTIDDFIEECNDALAFVKHWNEKDKTK